MEKNVVETLKDDCKQDTQQVLNDGRWYGSPKSTVQVKGLRKGGVPVKTQEQNI